MTTWTRYLALAAAWTAFGLLSAYAFTILIDPFGRLGIYPSSMIGFTDERPSMASRALDQQFNSAIVGNSASMMLMPAELDKLTGLKFVSLSISGSDAPATIETLRFFLDHHSSPRVVVVGLLPETWCGPTFEEQRPFPFWLYSTFIRYFLGMVAQTSFELINETFSDREKLDVPGYHHYIGIDGYHTYIGNLDQPMYTDPDLVRARLNAGVRPTATSNQQNSFPAIAQLSKLISVPSPAYYVLLWTPRYLSYIPAPGSEAERTDQDCRSALKDAAASLPNVEIVDWSEADRPENHEPMNFIDVIHYYRPLAERIEESIAQSLPIDLRGS